MVLSLHSATNMSDATGDLLLVYCNAPIFFRKRQHSWGSKDVRPAQLPTIRFLAPYSYCSYFQSCENILQYIQTMCITPMSSARRLDSPQRFFPLHARSSWPLSLSKKLVRYTHILFQCICLTHILAERGRTQTVFHFCVEVMFHVIPS